MKDVRNNKLFICIALYVIIILVFLMSCNRNIVQINNEPDSCYDARVRAIISENKGYENTTEVTYTMDCVKTRKWNFCLDVKNRPDGMSFKDCLLLKY